MFEWTQAFADWLIYNVFNIAAESSLGEALNFFVYDTIKILVLLFVIVFLMGIINVYFPIERLKNYLIEKNYTVWSIF